MAKTRKLTVTAPDGTLITRTTARTYSHVVLYRFDAAKREAFDASPAWRKTEASNYAYTSRNAADPTIGSLGAYVEGEPEWRTHQRDRYHAIAVDFITTYPTPESYHAACLASRRARSADLVAEGWRVAGWCGRLDLAQRLTAPKMAGEQVIVAVNA